jgi:hypothetical protein
LYNRSKTLTTRLPDANRTLIRRNEYKNGAYTPFSFYSGSTEELFLIAGLRGLLVIFGCA